ASGGSCRSPSSWCSWSWWRGSHDDRRRHRRRIAPRRPRGRRGLRPPDEAAHHLAAPLDHAARDDRRGPGLARRLARALDDGGRRDGRRRRQRDQPGRRPRHRRAHGAHGRTAGRRGTDLGPARTGLRAAAPGRQRAGAGPGRGLARGRARHARLRALRAALHALAEALDHPEHRDRGRRGRGAAARRLGGGHGRPAARRHPDVRRDLLLDAAPLLGAVAAPAPRLRAGRRADAAGGARHRRDGPAGAALDRRARGREPAALGGRRGRGVLPRRRPRARRRLRRALRPARPAAGRAPCPRGLLLVDAVPCPAVRGHGGRRGDHQVVEPEMRRSGRSRPGGRGAFLITPPRIVGTTVLIDLIGFGIVIPLAPLYAEDFGAREITVGLLTASYAFMQFVFAPVLGRLSDRVGRRPVILVSLAGSCVASLLFGVAQALWMLFLARILGGLSGASYAADPAYVAGLT